MKNKLFTDIYEPKDFKHFALPKRIKDHFPNGELHDNYLFSGTAGCGKSSLAKFLGRQYDFMYVNSSLDTSIDVLREGGDVYNFCKEFSFDSKPKVVLFDEIDGVSPKFFLALKGFYDTFKGTVKFLATTNHIEEIPEPIMSRFVHIDYSPQSKEEQDEWFILYRNRIYKIIKHIGIEVDKHNLNEFAKRFFPDFRYPLKTLQKLKYAGVKVIDETVINKKSFEHNDLYNMITTFSTTDNRKLHTAITSIANPTYAVRTIDRELFDYLDRNTSGLTNKYGAVVITIAKYVNMLDNRVDPTLVLKALIYELIMIVRR